jgi:hypothetical protein
VLHKVTRFKEQHEGLVHSFSTLSTLRDNWTVLTYNGDGIYLYSDGLRNKSISIRYPSSGLNKTETGQGIKFVNSESVIDKYAHTGIHLFTQAPLRYVLSYLKSGIDMPVPSHVLIVAGDLANRGINFVDSEYNWHLSHMYYMASATSDAAIRLQAMRVCGVFDNDGIVPEVWTRRVDIRYIIGFYKAQQELFDKLRKRDCVMNTEYKNVPVREQWVKGVKMCGKHKYHFNTKPDKYFDNNEAILSGKYLLIDRNKLTLGYMKIYDKFLDALADRGTGKWVKRSSYTNDAPTCGRLTELCQRFSVKCTKVTPGLVAKKKNGEWLFRLN